MSRNVLVVGMHRSGTSATTRLINLLGVSMCPDEDLIEAGSGNEAGYWESSRLTDLNEELLGTMGGAWWRPPMLTGDRLAAAFAEQGGCALDRFRESYPDEPWVWKDPRNCILLPFWRRVLGQDPVVVLALRNLHDVCRSLNARNGFSLEWSLAMCERYLGQALRALDGMPVVVTRYEQLVDDPRAWIENTADALSALGVRVTRPPAAEVAAFVRSDLRHSRHEDETMRDLPLTPAQRALVDTAFGLRGTYRSFPRLPIPAELASTTATLGGAEPYAAPGLKERPVRGRASRAGRPPVTVVVDVGPERGLSRRALMTCVATAPEHSEVLLVGWPSRQLETDLSRICADVTVGSCDPADLVDVVAEDAPRPAPGYVVFTSDLAHPHPRWAESLDEAFADTGVGAAGPVLRAWHQPGWSTAGLNITDAALNGAWLDTGPEGIHDVPLLSRHFMAVRRSVLAGVGGLDAAMTSDGVWDWELCARVWRGGHRIVAVPGATVTVRFADARPTSVPAFRRNLLRFAALHLGAEPLSQLITGLDARSDPDLVLDVLATEAPARRQWLHTSLSISSDGYSRHLLPA
ncbi:MAG: hypothetical protein ACLPKI_09160 [Streptosporangiaceae bacterium]